MGLIPFISIKNTPSMHLCSKNLTRKSQSKHKENQPISEFEEMSFSFYRIIVETRLYRTKILILGSVLKTLRSILANKMFPTTVVDFCWRAMARLCQLKFKPWKFWWTAGPNGLAGTCGGFLQRLQSFDLESPNTKLWMDRRCPLLFPWGYSYSLCSNLSFEKCKHRQQRMAWSSFDRHQHELPFQ